MSHVATAPASAPQFEERRPDLVDFLLAADLTGADALVEASEMYGDDADRELADLEAGTHPAQRSRRGGTASRVSAHAQHLRNEW